MALGIATAACAPKAPALPSGPGTPFDGYAAAYQEATASCRDVKTITASMGLSGKAGETKLRGRIDAGFAAPGRLRLEGIPPFGRPVFVLVADGPRATLVLPRDERVLRDAPRIAMSKPWRACRSAPTRLRTLVSGCGLASGAPADGRTFPNGWAAVSNGDATTFCAARAVPGRSAAAARADR